MRARLAKVVLVVWALAACNEVPPGEGTEDQSASNEDLTGAGEGGGGTDHDLAGADLLGVDMGGEVNPIAGVAAVEKVAGAFGFTEGPVWAPARGSLFFSDIGQGRIYELKLPSMVMTFHTFMTGRSNGLTLDNTERMFTCEQGTRRISRRRDDGFFELFVDRYNNKKLNSPNDLVTHKNGTIYFTDPPFGVTPGMRELNFQGVFRIPPAAALTTVATDMDAPNGIALSPDQRMLYVSDTNAGFIRKFPVNPDGSTGTGSRLLDTGGGGDGICVDDNGNLYVATPAGLKVYRESGAPWGTLSVAEEPANCAFGGNDRRTLFITARTSIYKVVVNVPGLP